MELFLLINEQQIIAIATVINVIFLIRNFMLQHKFNKAQMEFNEKFHKNDKNEYNKKIYDDRLKSIEKNTGKISGNFIGYKEYAEGQITSDYPTYFGEDFFNEYINTLRYIFRIFEDDHDKLYIVSDLFDGDSVENKIPKLFYGEYWYWAEIDCDERSTNNSNESKLDYRINAKLSYIVHFFGISYKKDLEKYRTIEENNQIKKINFCIEILQRKYKAQLDGYFYKIFFALEFLEQNFEGNERDNLAKQLTFQMSKNEIILLFYYCFYSKEINKSVKQYDLLQNYLNKEDLIREEHATLLDELKK